MVLKNQQNAARRVRTSASRNYFDVGDAVVKTMSIIVADNKMAMSYRGLISNIGTYQLRDIFTVAQWREAAPLYIFPHVMLLCLDNAEPQSVALAEQLTALQYEHQFRLIIHIDSALLDGFAHLALDSPEFLFSQAFAYEIGPVLTNAFEPIEHLVLQDDQQTLIELKRLSADAERIAEALARLSSQNKLGSDERTPVGFEPIEPLEPIEPMDGSDSLGLPNGLAETALGFRGMAQLKALSAQDGQTVAPRTTARSPVSIGADEVRQLLKARRMREAYFDSELFADPAWDILLDLYAAHLEDNKVSVSSLCIAANVPPTTALRWIRSMTDASILVRRDDESDGRRVWIELSDGALAKLVGYFTRLRKDGLIAV